MSDSLWPTQHARLPCPSVSPGVCSNSCPLSWWCHPTFSSSVAPFSFCLQSFPASHIVKTTKGSASVLGPWSDLVMSFMWLKKKSKILSQANHLNCLGETSFTWVFQGQAWLFSSLSAPVPLQVGSLSTEEHQVQKRQWVSECPLCTSSSRCVSSSARNQPWAGGVETPCTSAGELDGNARVGDSTTSDSKAWLFSDPTNSAPSPSVRTRFRSFSVLSWPVSLAP